jgi:hypothetical protein
MRNLIKPMLVAATIGLSSLAVSTPASAQSFGFYADSYGNTGVYGGYNYGYGNYGYGAPYYGRPYYSNYRNCRFVTRVRYDRWGRPYRARTQICRPAPRYGYGYGYGYGYPYGY